MLNKKKNMTSNHNLFMVYLLTLFLFAFNNLFAQFGGEISHVKTSLISEGTSIQPGNPFWVGLQITMDDDWHTYWLNPGDSGLPTSIKWDLPQGFTAGPIQWHYPQRIVTPPLVSYGYHGEIYLLVQITPPNDLKQGKKTTLKGNLSWLECNNVCLPGSAELSLELPIVDKEPKPDSRWIQIFSDAKANLPLIIHDWDINAVVTDNEINIQMIAPNWFKSTLNDITFFPYEANIIDYSDEQKLIDGNILTIKRLNNGSTIDSLHGVLVNPNGWRGENSEKSIEINIKVSEKLNEMVSYNTSELNSIWLALLFSFLGGIILNLMPCVLPVLSIKILGFVQNAHEKNSKPWKHGLIYGAGVLVSFWALAITLLLLRAGGEQLGWGFQLQSPEFLIILAVFMFLFSLTMFGVFEIGTSLTTIEGKTQKHSGWFGSFLSGVTATVVATPCTAPFMGSALGFALTQPVWASMMIFTFLAIGMALPFVLFSSIPSLLKFIPKPGRWMESLKQFMGFLLAATVVWLLWVLGIQLGVSLVIILLFAMLFIAIGAWIYGRWGIITMQKKTRRRAYFLAFLFIASSTTVAIQSVDKYGVAPGNQISVNDEGIQWQTFSEELLNTSLQEGKPVFVDFTAAWCLTCQVNEQVTFSSPEVIQKFSSSGIIALKADWTSKNESITKALAKFGRNSVPLYVLYSNGNDAKPKLLPEIITPDIIMNALKDVK